jgi:hypothetical protein
MTLLTTCWQTPTETKHIQFLFCSTPHPPIHHTAVIAQAHGEPNRMSFCMHHRHTYLTAMRMTPDSEIVHDTIQIGPRYSFTSYLEPFLSFARNAAESINQPLF